MPRKKEESHPNHERWLVSYADFITLLFAFFVVMFATSQTDKAKAEQVAESVKKALAGESFSSMVSVILGGTINTKGPGNAQLKGPGGAKRLKTSEQKQQGQIVELLPSLEVLTKELEAEIKSGKLQISMGARGLTISFTQAALFPSGEDCRRHLPEHPKNRQRDETDPQPSKDGRAHRRRSDSQFTLSKQLGIVGGTQHCLAGTADPVRCFKGSALGGRLSRYDSGRQQ